MSVRGDHVWLGGAGGIELFTQGHFYLLQWKDKDFPGRVSGVVETETGELWANGSSGITHVSAVELARWLRDLTSAITAEHFDARDGLPGLSVERIPEPSIAQSREGRLWFATSKGIAWLDPAKLEENRNRLPPPVVISSIFSNGKTYVGSNELTLPAHTAKLEIDYTALSLAIPERVLFRYKLDGVDNEWQDAGTRRQAFYTSLRPGRYRFHVMACNNDGVWNESGASLSFALAPAFYQTRWFLALCLAVTGCLVCASYMWRVRIVMARLDMQFRERLAERTRIAQELHDTLLQGVLSASMQLNVANDQIASDAPFKPLVTRVLELMGQVIEDGRNAVRGLRLSREEGQALDQAFSEVPQELALPGVAEYRVIVEGSPRSLHPVIRDEVYLIGREAVANAYRHSGATRIEVALEFGRHQLRVLVRDNGHGIDQRVLQAGREDHWGLSGMRERAEKIGAKLKVWSNGTNGTEVDLRVPGRNAFRSQGSGKANWLSRILARNADSTESERAKGA